LLLKKHRKTAKKMDKNDKKIFEYFQKFPTIFTFSEFTNPFFDAQIYPKRGNYEEEVLLD